MAFPRKKAAIVGVYTTQQGKLDDRTPMSLAFEALKGALDDAGLGLDEVDGIIANNFFPPYNSAMLNPRHFWPEQLGRPLGLQGGGMAQESVAKAALAIDAGMVDTVAYVWGRAGSPLAPRAISEGESPVALAPRVDDFSYGLWGAYLSTWYALWAQRYMHEFGATSEDLAEVAVTMRRHATLNPNAVMGRKGPITVDDVLGSRMICSPLHLLDCSIDNDGGYAIVVTSTERARDLKKKPVLVLGGAESGYIDSYINIDKPWISPQGQAVRRATDRAFEMSGVSRNDIDIAGLYDCFTITVIRDLEEMGFCEQGEGKDFVKDGRIGLGGALPVNPDGGLLSSSHCGHPSGMHVIETVRQLRGECGKRQVECAKIGVTLGQGEGVHGQAGTLILATE